MSNSNSEKVKTLDDVFDWGEAYLERYIKIEKGTDLEEIRRFRQELANFIYAVGSKWMGQRLLTLKPDNRKLLEDLYKELTKVEIQTAGRIIEVQRDQEAKERMNNLALPEDVGISHEIDYSSWIRYPLYYTEKLFTKLAKAFLPR